MEMINSIKENVTDVFIHKANKKKYAKIVGFILCIDTKNTKIESFIRRNKKVVDEQCFNIYNYR